MTDRTLIKGGYVLTQDPTLGEMAGADVLIEDDRIAAVGRTCPPTARASSMRTGDIVIPGFIDTHRHTWETSIRTSAPGLRADHLLQRHPRQVRPALSARRRLRGQPVGLARVHQRGHHDARRLVAHHEHARRTRTRRSGASRSRRSDRSSPTASATRRSRTGGSGPTTPGSVLTSDGPDARRIRKQYFNSDDGRITMALATRGPNFCKPDVVRHDWELAKELGLNITVHVAMDRFGYTKMQITGLRDMNLLYPNTTYVHASHFTDEEWALARDSGGNVSFAPQIEVQMGHGWAPAVTALEYGLPIGLSSDVATTAPSDQFTQMRSIFGSERGRKHQEAWDADLDGLQASPGLITVAPGPVVGDAGRRRGRGDRRPDRLAHARQEGGHRHHRWVGRERGADHRPRRGGRLRRGRLERQDRHGRRRDPQGGLPAEGLARRPAQGGRGVARLPGLEVRRARARLGRQDPGVAIRSPSSQRWRSDALSHPKFDGRRGAVVRRAGRPASDRPSSSTAYRVGDLGGRPSTR